MDSSTTKSKREQVLKKLSELIEKAMMKAETPEDQKIIEELKQIIADIKKLYGIENNASNSSTNIESYNNLFPKKKLPSGKFARTNPKNLQQAFTWFFKNFDYSWETILNATAAYVDDYEKKNYMYMQTSQYFIRKQQSDKTWGSELANWCSALEQGEDLSDDNHFKEKVV